MKDNPDKGLRLTEHEVTAIKQVFNKYFSGRDGLWLFGSRADITKKGGDIDLYIETHLDSLEKITQTKISFLVDLKQKIGDQKIDLIINRVDGADTLPIYEEAKATGVKLI